MRATILAAGAAAVLTLAACDRSHYTVTEPEASRDAGLEVGHAPGGKNVQSTSTRAAVDSEMLSLMEGVNARLAAQGMDYRVGIVDWNGMEMAGQTSIFGDRGNKQLDMHFVPRDPRRGWSGDPAEGNDDITWVVDQTIDAVPPGGGLTEAQTTAAITSAMATWEAVKCSKLSLTQAPTWGFDVGVLAWDVSGGTVGSPFVFADVHHAGWRDLDFYGGVLGATFTYFFIDAFDNPTDIDGNGKIDVAFREIYYDPSWIWSIGGLVDVESIAVHEMGHGLSQGHFGAMFQTNGNEKYHFAPKALMNAGYTGPQRELLSSDVGGHCSIWASWPNN